jgi:hypothetical protein
MYCAFKEETFHLSLERTHCHFENASSLTGKAEGWKTLDMVSNSKAGTARESQVRGCSHTGCVKMSSTHRSLP